MKIRKKVLFFAMFLMIFAGMSYAEITVEKHWTPYNPPTSYPDGTKVYIIVKGDTLWDLAGKFFNNPYLWPKIWEKNKYITDPHWIYPGDPLVIEEVETVKEAKAETQPEQEVKEFQEEKEEKVEEPTHKEIQQVNSKEEAKVTESATVADIKNAMYSITVDSPKDYEAKSFNGVVVEGDEDEQLTFAVPDVIYAKEFADGKLVANETYAVVRPEKVVKVEKDKYVVILQRLADVKVLCVNDGIATAKFIYSSHPVERGDFLVKLEYEPIPLMVDYKPKTGDCQIPDRAKMLKIYMAKDKAYHAGQGSTVVIEGGEKGGLNAGDIVQFFRKLKHIDRYIYLGEGVVLFSNDYTSTVKVVYSEKEMPVEETVAVKR
ncbi:conserved hypothetical protein [Thermotomaculum hydrothermale]|uniref:LysM domain-containing protein n=1 Tax=Thermotomaculum hydrothermale TaxID=981385 RepID=A0A7R6PLP2_9BACT|nr:LysM peptidoglycan-binding domain-containing protein [Thermotomaculum hydrothermale]BBB31868.1 conserved hypothetical protein [Thermotomaculum hydrothermale]